MPSKAPRSQQETRSGARVGMGTSPGLQRLVGPVSQTQTNVWVLYRQGVPGVSRTRGRGQRVPGELRPTICAGIRAGDNAHVNARVTKAPFAPPPPGVARRGPSSIFSRQMAGGVKPGHSQFFLTFSMTMLFKENVNVY